MGRYKSDTEKAVWVQVCGNHRGPCDAGLYTHATADTAKLSVGGGISERGKRLDGLWAACKYKVQIWQEMFLGQRVLGEYGWRQQTCYILGAWPLFLKSIIFLWKEWNWIEVLFRQSLSFDQRRNFFINEEGDHYAKQPFYKSKGQVEHQQRLP